VILDVRGGGNRVQEHAEVFATSGGVKRALAIELLGERDGIYDRATLVELEAGVKDPAMPFPVEHRLIEHLDGARDRVRVEEHRREDRYFRVF
jgi:hypothetical protein